MPLPVENNAKVSIPPTHVIRAAVDLEPGNWITVGSEFVRVVEVDPLSGGRIAIRHDFGGAPLGEFEPSGSHLAAEADEFNVYRLS